MHKQLHAENNFSSLSTGHSNNQYYTKVIPKHIYQENFHKYQLHMLAEEKN